MSLIDRTACELTELFRGGQVSAEEITQAFCRRIEAIDSKIGAFLHYERAAALSQAEALDRKRAAGKPLGRLAGVPVAIKDLICVKGEPATCASKILRTFVPPYDAHVVERLIAEDAVLIGRVNMDEFAMGSSTENSAFRTTHNPWNVDYVPGGSSGGSAAAVAAREAPLALGTDTGGSIRQPAALCGIVGLKPTYGRVSRYGLVAFASSLDQIGPMARNVPDAALLLDCIAGHDPRDSTCSTIAAPNYTAALAKPLTGLRIGIVPEHFGAGLDGDVAAAVRAAIEEYRKLGATTVEVSLPHSKYGIAAYYLVATAEASSNLARYDGIHYGHRAAQFSDLVDLYSATRGEAFGAEVKRRIMLGTFSLSAGYRDAYYVKALQVRRLIKGDYDAAFAQVDVIAGPTTPAPAFKIGSKTADPLEMYLSDIYTVSTNLAGIPGISLPCGFAPSGLPIGLQLQAAPFGEATLLRAAALLQSATDWHVRTAPISAEASA